MHHDLSRPWRATHLIHTSDPALARVPVMLCPDASGDGPAYTREEWEAAQQLGSPPTPVWTRAGLRWFALGTAATLRDGQVSFWAVALSPSPILLVEDDPDLRDVLAEVLTGETYTVHTADDGLSALKQLERLPRPCVVLLDWLMPNLDGAGLLRELERRDAFAGLTVVVTTHFSGPIPDARVARVLRKPYEIGAMLELLARYCYPRE